MKALAEITKDLADARALERSTGLLTDDRHSVFFVYDDGQETRAEIVSQHGDIYEAIKTLMVRVMLKKVRNIDKVRAVVIEAHAAARKVPTEFQHIDPSTLDPETVATWETQDVTVTIGHDGETVTNHTRGATTDAPNFDEVGDTSSAVGRLAEAVETLTLGVLLAAQLNKENDD